MLRIRSRDILPQAECVCCMVRYKLGIPFFLNSSRVGIDIYAGTFYIRVLYIIMATTKIEEVCVKPFIIPLPKDGRSFSIDDYKDFGTFWLKLGSYKEKTYKIVQDNYSISDIYIFENGTVSSDSPNLYYKPNPRGGTRKSYRKRINRKKSKKSMKKSRK